MYVQALKHFPHIPMVSLALLLFVGSFIAILITVYKMSTHKELSEMPLKDEETANG